MYNTSPIQEKYVYTKDVSAFCCYYTCTALKIGDFLIKDKTKRFNNMYLPEETTVFPAPQR